MQSLMLAKSSRSNILYAYPGDSLYQPVYRGTRSDLDISTCTTQR